MGGGKSSTTTSEVQIPPEVLARYGAVNQQAQTAAANPFHPYGSQASDFVAQINPEQTAGISGVNQASGAASPYFASATDATKAGMGEANLGDLDIQKYLSPYLSTVQGSTAALMNQSNEQAQSGALGTAAASGAFGGDRAGIAAANLNQQNQLAMGSTMANIANEGYGVAANIAQGQQGAQLSADQANLMRQMQGGAQLASLGQADQQAQLQGAEAQMSAGTMQQQTDQAGKTALINQYMQQQGYPFQVAQFLANIAEGTGALSGSTTQTTSPSSWWSDERLKHSISKIGKTGDGQTIYTFKYKNDPDQRTHIGLMAQEVEQAHPDAVATDPVSGYKAVDYDRALGDAKYASGGQVDTPYNSGVGAAPGGGGYVPAAYLPVGQLMMADPALAQQQQGGLMGDLGSAADFASKIASLKDTWGHLTGKASGGPVDAPNNALGYLQPTLEAQSHADKPTPPQAAQASGQQKSGFSQALGDVASIASLFALKDGGRVGFADGGTPEEIAKRASLAAQLGSQLQEWGKSGSSAPTGDLGVAATGPRATPPAMPTGMPDVDAMGNSTGLNDAAASPATPAAQVPHPAYGPRAIGAAVPANPNYTPLADLFSKADPVAPAAPVPAPPAPIADLSTAGVGAQPVDPALGLPSVMRPQPRPADLGLAKSPVVAATAPPSVPVASPRVDSGQPDQAMSSVVPLKTQIGFVLHELPTASGFPQYMTTRYATPEDAAAAFDKGYERSAGTSTDQRRANARTVYDAYSSGKLAALPPNVQEVFNGMIAGGMDPVKAAGAVGNFMTEAYGHIDPGAHNSKEGAFGIAQWEGPRVNALAAYAGVSPNDIASSPSVTPEGRRYSQGLGSAAIHGGDGATSMAGGDLGGAKPWDERNALGKMVYDPATNKVSKNAILSLLSGIGTMASSPSRYLGASILQGIGGVANTYQGLQEQNANIAQTQAQTNQMKMQTNAMRFFQAPGGLPMVTMPDGTTMQYWDFINNPAATSNVPPDQLAAIKAQADGATGGNASIFSDPTGQAILAAEKQRVQGPDYQAEVTNSTALKAAAAAASAGAVGQHDNTVEQAKAVSDLLSQPGITQPGALGQMKSQMVNYANSILRAIGQPEISSADTDTAILDKIRTGASAAAASANGQTSVEALNLLASGMPNVGITPEANAQIMSNIMMSQQKAIDKNRLYSDYASATPQHTVLGADQMFARTMPRYDQERNSLAQLMKLGGQKGTDGVSVIDRLTSGNLSKEDAQGLLKAVLGDNASPDLYRYFIPYQAGG